MKKKILGCKITIFFNIYKKKRLVLENNISSLYIPKKVVTLWQN